MNWYDILKAARRVARKGELTSQTLGLVTGLEVRAASAWLSKFQRWGYVLPNGTTSLNGGRWMRTYLVTRWGQRFRPKTIS